jgi:hypothetical protein
METPWDCRWRRNGIVDGDGHGIVDGDDHGIVDGDEKAYKRSVAEFKVPEWGI